MSNRSRARRELSRAGRVIGPADYSAKDKAAAKRERKRLRNLALVATQMKAKP